MKFDFGSFIIGALLAFVISFVAYRRREDLSALSAKIRVKFAAFKNQLTAGMEQRYSKALLVYCDQLALAYQQADFAAVYIAQHFDPPPARPSLNPIDPASLQPIPMAVALHSTQRLAVLGQAGTGRTTLLTKIARVHTTKQAPAELGTSDRLPLLLHLAEIDWNKATESDPLSALIPAGTTAHVSSLIASNVGNLMKGRVKRGTAILLLDGLDEITPQQRTRCLAWLAALLAQFPNNQVVVTTGLLGYGALQNLGFAALQLAGWTFRDIDQFTQNWITVLGGGRQDRKIVTAAIRQMSHLAAGPIDLTLALIDWRTRMRFPTSRIETYDHWLERAVRPAGASEDLLSTDKLSLALGRIAWTLYQEQRWDVGLDEIQQAIEAVSPESSPEAQSNKASSTPAANMARAIADKSGLFMPFSADAYTFAHRCLAAYLAAYHAAHTVAALGDHFDQTEWSMVFDFYAALTDPAMYVGRALNSPDDLSRTHLSNAARWTGYAAPEAPWRSRTMGELARNFLQPDQLTPLRERTLDGLVATHDKGLAFLLKKGLTQTDLNVRRLCLLGLGQLGRENDLPLFNAALKDPNAEIRSTALRAIGAIARDGSAPATELLIRLLLELDENGQQLVAELLADCGEEGQQILREATGEEEIKVRRAATFGLAATGADWARELLHKMEREESQWYVRTAALEALKAMEKNTMPSAERPPIDLSPVLVEQQPWLVEWAAQQGLGIGVGRQSVNALMRALEQGQPNVRQAALQTLRFVGDLELHDKLRALLADPDQSVRDAAYVTLESIGQRAGMLLPR